MSLACGTEIKIVSAACDQEPARKIKMPLCQGKIGIQMVKTMRDPGC